MGISYKRLMDFLDDQLAPGDLIETQAALRQDGQTWEMLERLKRVLKDPRFQEPPSQEYQQVNENTLAAYLDGTLPKEDFLHVEEILAQDDYQLAQAALCHRVITSAHAVRPSEPMQRAGYLAGKGHGADPLWNPFDATNPTKESSFNASFIQPLRKTSTLALLGISLLLVTAGIWMSQSASPPEENFHKAFLAWQENQLKKKAPVVKVDEEKQPENVKKGEEPGPMPLKEVKEVEKKATPKAVRRILSPEKTGSQEELKIKTKGAALLRQGEEWRVSAGPLLTGQEMHLLPGTCVQIVKDNAPEISFWGARLGIKERLAPARFIFHLHDGYDFSFSLLRGTAILSVEKTGKFLVRLGSPPQLAELELSPGSTVALESYSQIASSRLTERIRIVPLAGRVTLWLPKEESPRPALVPGFAFEFNPTGGMVRESPDFQVEELDPFHNQPQWMAAREELRLALKPGVNTVKAIESFLDSPLGNDARRQLAYLAVAALNSPERILQELGTNDPSGVKRRQAAWLALREWACDTPENFSRMQGENTTWLARKFPQDIGLFLELLNPQTGEGKERVEKFLQGLLSGLPAIREECRRNLNALLKGQAPPNFDSDPKTRELEIARWRELFKAQ
ncbi:MAG: hypothetical protein EXR99_06695 [Gemmataceae bacterium]|nr:hypothetical protein [Gemmataceae bacterium]